MIVIVMGVSGSGKSTIATALAEHMGAKFLEGDDFHPEENVAKMAQGIPLIDTDRWPWLDRLNAILGETATHGRPMVLACSALKAVYRQRLTQNVNGPLRMVFLRGDKDLIARRLADRQHRFMPATLLDSQFEALQPVSPDEGITVDIRRPVDEILDEVMQRLALANPRRA